MHHFGGMQYAGMDKEAVKKSRELIRAFNEKANPFEEKCWYKNIFGLGERKAPEKTFQSYEEYKIAKDKLKEELKKLKPNKPQNLITKLGKGIGKFLTMDLETIKSYKGTRSFNIRNIGTKTSNVLRNIGGVPLRIGVWAGLTMGVLDGIINKGIKGCFGNYYDRFKDEENVTAKKDQKKFLKEDLRARLQEAQNEKVLGMMNPITENNNTALNENSNPEIAKDTGVHRFAEKAALGKDSTKEEISPENNTESKTQAEEPLKEISPLETTKEQKISKNKVEDAKVAEEPLKEMPILKTEASEFIKDKEPENIPAKTSTDPETNKPENKKNDIKEANKKVSNTVDTEDVKNKVHKKVKLDNYTYIPSSENVIKKEDAEVSENKYIPSQQGAKITKTFDNSGLEAALRRADRAEQRALQTLAGNFNSY